MVCTTLSAPEAAAAMSLQEPSSSIPEKPVTLISTRLVARDDVRPTYSVLDNMMLRLTGIPEPLDWKTALKEYLEETGGIE